MPAGGITEPLRYNCRARLDRPVEKGQVHPLPRLPWTAFWTKAIVEIISRKEARQRGLKKFFTGTPCKNGGVDVRITSSGSCCCAECKKQRYAVRSDWCKKNYARVSAYLADYRARNKEKAAAYYSAYRLENHGKIRQIASKWAKRNPAKKAAERSIRRARERNATPGWFGELDAFVFAEAYDLAVRRKSATGFKWEVDHIIPLGGRNVSGLHVWTNVQVIPMIANRKKGNRHFFGDEVAA